ncbi:MAG TPA: hypothetical protein VGF45_06330 [Polyangia bacterium]
MNTADIQQSVRNLVSEAPDLEEVKARLQTLNQQVTSVIKEHPGKCLLGALTLGFLLARIARRGD